MQRRLISALFLLATVLPALAQDGIDARDASSQQADQAKDEEAKPKRETKGSGKEPHAPASAYMPDEVLGWKLLVHEDLTADKELYKKILDQIQHELYLINETLPQEKVKLLKEVTIWVELNNPNSNAAQYHPSKNWLANNGYLPEKAKCVEISNAKSFIRRWPRHKANTMLHEFAHAYHDLHLGFGHKGILKSFKQAEASGSYDEVRHIGGGKIRHYALTDHKEYFAEATEAFFGANDFYPFVRPELKEHDPAMHDIVKEVWGVKR